MEDNRTVLDVRGGSRAGPGTRLNDLYEIDAPIAIGGMGEVFRGHVIETGDPVAIKVMRAEFAQNALALALFRKEASALHTVHHGAVVRYYVFSVDRQLGLPYLAMEYVTGESLADRLRRGPLDYDAVEILRRRLAGGLGAAHEAGIVHRDVTPDNIILPAGDVSRAKIIDFGIARLAATQTVIGDGFAGKYAYASPEQLGLQGGEITPRSDIYSLGLVLAQASLGRALDMGDHPAASVAKRSVVPNLTGIDARLVPLLEAMLCPDPRLRLASMAEVEGWGGPATQIGPAPPGRPSTRSQRKRLAIGAAVLILAGGIAAVAVRGPLAMWPAGNSPRPDETGPALSESPQRPPPPNERVPIEARVPSADQGTSIEHPQAPPTPQRQPSKPQLLPPIDPGPESQPRPATEAAKPEPTPAPASGRDQARLEPPVAAPAPAEPTMERVAAFIRGYPGGDCFFLNPTTVSAQEAIVEAYGTAPKPFLDFDAAFRRALGFEAKIQLRQIEPGQCAVVDLLARQAQFRPANVPKLRLDNDRLRSGDELRGTVELGDAQNVALLLVERDGTVHDLRRYLKRSGRQASFTIRLEVPPAGRGRPQLVLAVGSREPVAALAASGRPGGTASLPSLAQEMSQAGTGFGLAARLIKVGD